MTVPMMHMTTEELNTQLYEKMFAEQEKYRQWLLAQPPDEILKHAYEYTIREDILLSLEYNELLGKQAQAKARSQPSKSAAHKEPPKKKSKKQKER